MRREELIISGKTVADYQAFAKTFIEDALGQGLLRVQYNKDRQYVLAKKDCRIYNESAHTTTGQPLDHFFKQKLEHRTLKLLLEIIAVHRDGFLTITMSWYPWSEPIAKYAIEKMYEVMGAPFPAWMIREELEAKQRESEFIFLGTGEDFYARLDHHYARQVKNQFEGYLGRRIRSDRQADKIIEGITGCFTNATLETWQKDKESETDFVVVHLDGFGRQGKGDWLVHLRVDRQKLREGLDMGENDIHCLRLEYKDRLYNISTCPTPIRGGTKQQILRVGECQIACVNRLPHVTL